jgi:ribosome-binding factor A
MNTRTDRIGFIIRDALAPFIIEYVSEKWDEFWIVSIVNVTVTKDYSYADFFVSSTRNTEDLPKYLAKYAWELRSMIGKDLWVRKTPIVRFKVAKNIDTTWDILSIINEMSEKYGLN